MAETVKRPRNAQEAQQFAAEQRSKKAENAPGTYVGKGKVKESLKDYAKRKEEERKKEEYSNVSVEEQKRKEQEAKDAAANARAEAADKKTDENPYEGSTTFNNDQKPTVPSGGGNTTDPKPPTPPVDDSKPDVYDTYISKIAKQQGLGKYVNEDGTVDYDRLQKSKVGFQILNALVAGIGGAAAGAAGKDAPDMSKGMLAQQVAKRDTVVEKAKEAAQQEKDNAVDMATFTDKLGLQGKESERLQKEMARFMSRLSIDQQKAMMNYLKDVPMTDAIKAQFVQNPIGSMNMMMSGLGSFVPGMKFSDEGCKKFANRRIFN